MPTSETTEHPDSESRGGANAETKIVGRNIPLNGRALVGVSTAQALLLRTAVSMHDATRRWPTAAELACAASAKLPDVWTDLRALHRIGCVEWAKVARVVRAADGVVAVLGGDA